MSDIEMLLADFKQAISLRPYGSAEFFEDKIIAKFQDLESQLEWIDVNDELPPLPKPAGQYERYLTTRIDTGFTDINNWHSGGFWEYSATHWKPLPKPPTKKEEIS